MPSRKQTPPAPRTRLIRSGVGACIEALMPDVTGAVRPVETYASYGDEVALDPIAEMSLDSVGALAPPGWSREDLEADDADRIARYRAARSQMPGPLAP